MPCLQVLANHISCSSTDLSVEPSPITQTNLVSDTILERFLNCTSAIYFMKDFAQLMLRYMNPVYKLFISSTSQNQRKSLTGLSCLIKEWHVWNIFSNLLSISLFNVLIILTASVSSMGFDLFLNISAAFLCILDASCLIILSNL